MLLTSGLLLSIAFSPEHAAFALIPDFRPLVRWLVKSANDALLAGATGYNARTIADVVELDYGLIDAHKMTFGVYAVMSGDVALKSCLAG